MNHYHCRAWDSESTILSTTGVFPDFQAAQAAVNNLLAEIGSHWNCEVTRLIPPTDGQGFYETGESVFWEYTDEEEEA